MPASSASEMASSPSISRAAQGVLAEHLEHIGQQCNSGAEQHQPEDIKGRLRFSR